MSDQWPTFDETLLIVAVCILIFGIARQDALAGALARLHLRLLDLIRLRRQQTSPSTLAESTPPEHDHEHH